ncbi:hypothetical protein [Alkalibacillus haloalkaliphilus]|uniref:hypothetical protein n=1 Tax=Alkalibacillus haloalkaliphilus TaxID=94136 RepID=UPI002935E9D7|nr:hypothetical protein [Alkalibacillus haloalkaliphilus]MDV2580978.1 hypothetical protein [Alkalibacillus haloalkaliphilus]
MLLKREEGFILQDAVLTLICFSLLVSLTIPFITQLYKHHHDIKRHEEAYNQLQQAKAYILQNEPPASYLSEISNESFSTILLEDNQRLIVCIEWKDSNETNKELCQYIPNYM